MLDYSRSKRRLMNFFSSENDTVTELLYGGGARGGKSAFGCIWQILRRITLPGSVGLVCRVSTYTA